jgi:RimJ/RimL family protein N-acetyltransferase
VGYWVHVAHTGRGHVTAAARALVDVAFSVRGARRVVIRCDQANTRSAAVAERLGFRLDRLEPHPIEAPGHTGTFQIWVLDPPDGTAEADLR